VAIPPAPLERRKLDRYRVADLQRAFALRYFEGERYALYSDDLGPACCDRPNPRQFKRDSIQVVMTLTLKAKTALHGAVTRKVDVDAHRIMLGTIVRRAAE
jgi:hypothetical protein